MTIAELGSLGELIAALATVATLVYLALQIRQNTRALRHAAERAVLEDANSWRANLVQHPEVAELYRRGLLESGSLDPIERLRFRMLLDSLFDTWQYMFQSADDPAGIQKRYVQGTLAQPGGARYWENAQSRFSPAFVEYIEGLARMDGHDG